MSDKPLVVVISGPTAAGKTSVALRIAGQIPATIVCADSRQLYQMMDVGTAKPTPAEMSTCKHLLFDHLHPASQYSAGQYAADIEPILERGLGTVLLVGGTGLYINAALDGLTAPVTATSKEITDKLSEVLETQGKDALYEWLCRADPRAAHAYADKNPRRVLRALEHTLQHGTPFSSTWDIEPNHYKGKVLRFVIDREKDELKTIINNRCEQMWENGLEEETQRILAAGVHPMAQSLQTVGYSQVLSMLGHGTPLTKAQAIESHKSATRKYAKRQRTWFKKDVRYQWLNTADATESILRAIAKHATIASLMFLAQLVLLGTAYANPLQQNAAQPAAFPTQYDSTQAIKRLAESINGVFQSKAYRNTQISCRVWSLTKRQLIYDRNGEVPLTPASTTKLFSTSAAFHALGATGALTTEVRATGRLLSDGTLEGDLYLVGMGDAMLSVTDLENMADELFAIGVRRIRGKIYGDGSFFDSECDRATYSGDGEEVQNLPPIHALCLNQGVVAVLVSATRNGRVSAQTLPASDAVRLEIVKGATRRRSRRARLSATSQLSKDGIQTITVTGTPGANRTRTLYVTMSNPPLFCAGAFANRLRSGGIDVQGGIGVRRFASNSRVLTTTKRSLVEFCSVVNKRSHNFFAEQVFKVVGGQYGGRTNTAAVAKASILSTLDSMGVERRGAVFNDGSGLSRRNRVSAATEVDLLRAIQSQPYAAAFRSTLAIAGVDGTIRNRMSGTPAENNVAAKTGTLRNVSALAGYVTTLDGDQWCFSILSNGPYTRSYKAAENTVAVLLAGFTYGNKSWTPGQNNLPEGSAVQADSSLLDTGLAEEDADILDTLAVSKHPVQTPRQQQRKRNPK